MAVESDIDIFDDFPEFTPGRVHYGTLKAILRWEQKQGIATITQSEIDAYRLDGYSAARAGLELGLIDYPQATGCEE